MRQIEDPAQGGAGKGAEAPRRFAIILIAEAISGEKAEHLLKDRLGVENTFRLAATCPVGPAVRYEVIELRLAEDGEPVVTTPDP
jgi:hypothetical protein